MLKTVKYRYNLDRNIVEWFGIDIDELSSNKIFQIWLPDGICKTMTYIGDNQLGAILKKLASVRELDDKEYKPYYTSGRLVSDTQITLQEFEKKVVYFLPNPPVIQSFPLAKKSRPKKSPKSKTVQSTPVKAHKQLSMNPFKTPPKKPLQRSPTTPTEKVILDVVQQEFDLASSESDHESSFIDNPNIPTPTRELVIREIKNNNIKNSQDSL